MPSNAAFSGLAVLSAEVAFAAETRPRGASLLETWSQQLDSSSVAARDTPVTRVVNLLKQMQGTLEQEMTEDKKLHKELMCWCNDNKYEKGNSIGASESKISDLTAQVKELTAKSASLTVEIKTLEDQVAADKTGLAEATELREKEQKEFKAMHGEETQNLENLKDAIAAIERAGQGGMAASALFSQLRSHVSFQPLSLLALGSRGRDSPFDLDHESDDDRQMDQFLNTETAVGATVPKFLQQIPEPMPPQEPTAVPTAASSLADDASVRRGIKIASAFVQRKYGGEYAPQSGQIVGVLKQMQDEMAAELSEAVQKEQEDVAAFSEMNKAKTKEIRSGEEQAETKEDRLAETNNDLAEAKEDLDKEGVVLGDAQAFSKNLGETCDAAETNFALRREGRQEEIQAVSETIEILTADEARDAMRGTYSFLQLQSSSEAEGRTARAAAALRRAAAKFPGLALFANGAQLDTFSRVKKAIDDMIGQLKTEQADEVKKNDWCKSEIHENEMAYEKLDVKKGDLAASIGEMETTIATLDADIKQGHATIAQLHQDLQRASEDRKKANTDYQMMVEDQTMTVEVLIKASEKLSSFYNKESLAQASFAQSRQRSVAAHGKAKHVSLLGKSKQTPPVVQKEYKPNGGATGIIGMIQKLIGEAKNLVADAKKGESQAQTDYEKLVADTADEVHAIGQEITSKIEVKAATDKDKAAADGDLQDAVAELEDLFNYGHSLDEECSYITKNFDVRQQARTEEIGALQEAKNILSGALSDAA